MDDYSCKDLRSRRRCDTEPRCIWGRDLSKNDVAPPKKYPHICVPVPDSGERIDSCTTNRRAMCIEISRTRRALGQVPCSWRKRPAYCHQTGAGEAAIDDITKVESEDEIQPADHEMDDSKEDKTTVDSKGAIIARLRQEILRLNSLLAPPASPAQSADDSVGPSGSPHADSIQYDGMQT